VISDENCVSADNRKRRNDGRVKRHEHEDWRLKEHIQHIQRISESDGIPGVNISELITLTLILARRHESELACALLQSCVPRDAVKEIDALRVVAALGTFDTVLRATAVQWLQMLCETDSLTSTHCLRAAYPALFHLLHDTALRPHLCPLLVLLTTPGHVLAFRLRYLRRLCAEVGTQEPWLLQLLRVFEVFDRHAGTSVADTQPLRVLVPLCLPSPSVFDSRRVFSLWKCTSTVSCADNVSAPRASDWLTSLYTFDTSFLDSFTHTRAASCVATQLQNASLHCLFAVHPSAQTACTRLRVWLESATNSLFFVPVSEYSSRTRLLSALVTFLQTINEPSTLSAALLATRLQCWDFQEDVELWLTLFEFLPLLPYEDFYTVILHPLHRAFPTLPVRTKARVLLSLTQLLRRWAHFVASLPSASHAHPQFDYHRTIFEFVTYIERLMALALQSEEGHLLLQHTVLIFLELVCMLHTKYTLPFVFVPSQCLVLPLFLSSSLLSLSRICGVLAHYKTEVTTLRQVMQSPLRQLPATRPLSFSNGLERVSLLNQYIWTFCQALWCQRLFLATTLTAAPETSVSSAPSFSHPSLLFESAPASLFDLPSQIKTAIWDMGMESALSLVHHIALLHFGWRYLKDLECSLENFVQPPSKLNAELIKGAMKLHYLEYLKQSGCHGLYEFLNTYVGTLVQQKQQLTTSTPSSDPTDASPK
jgi:hypothetical protein